MTIVDAGSRTIDISSYIRNLKSTKGTFKEVSVPQRMDTFTF